MHPNLRFLLMLLGASFVLLLPYIGMQYSSEVNWGSMDFALAGFLLFATVFSCELILRKVSTLKWRAWLISLFLLLLFLLWAELAVGLFDSPISGS